MEATTLARAEFELAGAPLRVLSLSGEEALSQPFHYRIECLLSGPLPAALGQPAVLRLQGFARAGLVAAVDELGEHPRGRRVVFRLQPRLALLAQSRNSTLFRDLSVVEIARLLLRRHGYGAAQLACRLGRDYTPRAHTLQAGETDLAFLQRVLARAGIFFYSESEDDQERVVLADHNAACAYLPLGLVHYRPQTAQPRTLAGAETVTFDRLEHRCTASPTRAAVHVLSDPLPERPRSTDPGAERVFCAGAPGTLAAAEQEALHHNQAASAQAQRLRARGQGFACAAGAVLSLEAALLDPSLSGDYLIVRSELELAEPEEHGGNTPSALRVRAELQPRARVFRPRPPPRPPLPLLVPARIEGRGRYAELDPLGRYRARADLEQAAHAQAEATAPLQALSPYGGPPQGQPVGLHLPMQDGTQVLLTCLNDDPDRPLIVGFAPSAAQPGPVSADNGSQNRLLTPAGNELRLDDARNAAEILLQTFDGQTVLRLSATAEHPLAELACQYGAMHLLARRTQRLSTGTELHERVGAGRTQLVEQRSRTQTRHGEIHHQAASDIRARAGAHLRTRSGADTQLVAGQRLLIHAGDDVAVSVQGADGFRALIKNGELSVQAAKDIRISGRGGGDICFENRGGGFAVEASGKVHLFGRALTLKAAGEVSLNGPVDYSVPEGNSPASPSVAAPLRPRAIDALALAPYRNEQRRALILRLHHLRAAHEPHRFELRSDGGYRASRTCTDDVQPANGTLDLLFENLDPYERYTLVVVTAAGERPLFRNLPFSQLLRPGVMDGR